MEGLRLRRNSTQFAAVGELEGLKGLVLAPRQSPQNVADNPGQSTLDPFVVAMIVY